MLSPRLNRKFRESFAIIVWLYVLLKLFVLDIDVVIFQSFLPSETWLLRYRLVFILLIFSLCWLIMGTGWLAKNLLYVLFYPFVIIFWKVPKIVFQTSINVMFGIIITSVVAMSSAKKWFSIGTFSLIATLLIVVNPVKIAMILGMVFLFAILLRHFWLRFRTAFSSQTLSFKRLITFLQAFQTQREKILLGNLERCTDPEGSDAYEKDEAKRCLASFSTIV